MVEVDLSYLKLVFHAHSYQYNYKFMLLEGLKYDYSINKEAVNRPTTQVIKNKKGYMSNLRLL